jgi:hypothetical protein
LPCATFVRHCFAPRSTPSTRNALPRVSQSKCCRNVCFRDPGPLDRAG